MLATTKCILTPLVIIKEVAGLLGERSADQQISDQIKVEFKASAPDFILMGHVLVNGAFAFRFKTECLGLHPQEFADEVLTPDKLGIVKSLLR